MSDVKARILERYKSGKLAHAILLHGGEEKLALAMGIVQEISGVSNEANADLLLIEKDEGKKEITVDKTRAIAEFVNQTSANSGKKIIIINTACELNRSAANAILKNLEEPSSNSFFILIANNFSRVLPTIRSRCQSLKIPPISLAQFEENLRQQDSEISSTEAKILADICQNSVANAMQFGVATIKVYQSFLESLLAGKIEEELLKKISDKNFDFKICEAAGEFFGNRLFKFLQNSALDFLPNESQVFLQLSEKFSPREILFKVDEALISLRKSVPMSLNKALSFINFFNRFR
jgi:DNA polymerase III delta prime subunit